MSSSIFANNQQTSTIMQGAGQPTNTDIRGHGFGRSRTGTKGRWISAFAYGHDIAIGRGVVYSAQHNLSPEFSLKSVSLPDATGDYTLSPFNNLPLSDASNASLLAAQKVDGDYKFAGIIIDAKYCYTCDCAPCGTIYPACPVGNPDNFLDSQIGERSKALSIAQKGEYMWVPTVEAVVCDDNLSLVDDPAADPCINLLGSFAKAGNGALDLPASIVVTRDAIQTPNGGFIAEIYIG